MSVERAGDGAWLFTYLKGLLVLYSNPSFPYLHLIWSNNYLNPNKMELLYCFDLVKKQACNTAYHTYGFKHSSFGVLRLDKKLPCVLKGNRIGSCF